ncbi:MAG TPA: methionine--tRNA ligase, partial [Pyrinomonadaceae bacterium]|nr:methionine--tRNA ligase [Pyrinomonadaceae bacterium]
MKTFYVTTPIYYANSLPHLGHLYTMIVCDTIARSKRQRGIDTYFLTGTDEHGINIERAAQKQGRTPQQQADFVVDYFKKMTREFGLDTEHGGYDIFMRTTAPFHYQGVGELWRRCAKSKTPKGNDAIYKGHYEGWFCAACAAYKTEDEYHKPATEGGVPTCMVHETPLDRVSEESYFFRLADYAEALLELYEKRPDFVRPESRRNEVISFVRGGLQDLSISRLKTSVSWGVPVPDDPNHTMYVWFDALTNYITAIGFGNEERERVAGFEKYWPALHMVGKDILRFHAVYWPSFLMAAGIELPRAIVAHGMWLDPNGRKMSKTIGNTVELDVLHKHFSIDAIRYFCLREMVFGQDGRFGYEGLIDRSNSDLASGLGNLSSRTLTMIARYCDGRIPSGQIPEEKLLFAKRTGVDTDETTVAGFVETARDQFLLHLENLAFSRALEVAWSIVARADKMITEAKPWDLAKDENQRHTLGAVLYRAAETLRWLNVLLYPVMPEASRTLAKQLGLSETPDKVDPATLKWGELREGTQIGDVQPVFPRLDKTQIMSEIQNTATPVPAADPTPQSASPEQENFIDIDDFAKVDLRVGTVLSAERVPKADKLLLLKIDLNEAEPRQVLAGIAQYYDPEKLIG